MKGHKKPPFSEEHKQKLSDSHKGKIPWNKGKPCSEESRQNMIIGWKSRKLKKSV